MTHWNLEDRRILTIACAYCGAALKCSCAAAIPRRVIQVARIKCGSCDSIFDVMIATARRRPGRRWKGAEAKRKAEIEAAAAAARIMNEVRAKEMLAEPGCTCGTRSNNPPVYGYRADGLVAGHIQNGIEGPPLHRTGCPCAPPIKL